MTCPTCGAPKYRVVCAEWCWTADPTQPDLDVHFHDAQGKPRVGSFAPDDASRAVLGAAYAPGRGV